MSRLVPYLLVSLAALPAHAEREKLFGSGKPPIFQEEDTDRRFLKTKVARALEKGGSEDPRCQQLLGGLLLALAEIAPSFHKADENFTLDPHLLAAVDGQLSNPRFPATDYLKMMVRKVWLDRKLPDAWLAAAEALQPHMPERAIDLGKLRYLNAGLRPVDSFYLTLGLLRERYDSEVGQANAATRTEAEVDFHDTYLDRDVAWGGATLVDVKSPKVPAGKVNLAEEELPPLVATLKYTSAAPAPAHVLIPLLDEKRPPVTTVVAKLSPKQFVDLARLHRGRRLLVRGRFWDVSKKGRQVEVEVRDALLFEDPDFSKGVAIADPHATAACPMATNDLTGLSPRQPGGFAH